MPLSTADTSPPEWLTRYHNAITLYRGREFERAAAEFAAVNDQLGGGDFLCGMYAARCTRLIREAPKADWDGSYALTEK
jgi:hypothetical protein